MQIYYIGIDYVDGELLKAALNSLLGYRKYSVVVSPPLLTAHCYVHYVASH